MRLTILASLVAHLKQKEVESKSTKGVRLLVQHRRSYLYDILDIMLYSAECGVKVFVSVGSIDLSSVGVIKIIRDMNGLERGIMIYHDGICPEWLKKYSTG